MAHKLPVLLDSLGELFIDSRRLINRGLPYPVGPFLLVCNANLLDERFEPIEQGSSSLVTVKRLRRLSYDDNILAQLVREVRAWKDLNYRYILPITGFYLSPDLNEALLISPWKERGNLHEYLNVENPSYLERMWFAIQILNGLHYMHNVDLHPGSGGRMGIVHGNLKAANLIIDDNFDLIHGDVGLSRILQDPNPAPEHKGTLRWMSSELFTENGLKTTASDIWAWACVVYEIMTGVVPYNTIELDEDVWDAIGRGDKPGSSWELQNPVDLWPVISPCWSLEPTDRPSTEECFAPLMSAFAIAVERILRAPILKNGAISKPGKTKARAILDRLVDFNVPLAMGELASILDDLARLSKSTRDEKTTNTLYAVRDDIKLNHVE